MITETFVQLEDDATGKKIDNVEVTTAAGQVLRQGICHADPENPNARQAVLDHLPPSNAYAGATREVAPGFDSGMVELTDAYAAVAGGNIKGGGVLLCNLTATLQRAFLKDATGKLYLNGYPLQGNQTIFVPFGRVTIVGVSEWKAGANGAINAQLVGEI